MQDDKELRKNAEGYNDPTAYKAMRNIERYPQFKELLETIFYAVETAGFEIEGRIVLKDTVTGKVWR